MKYIGTIVEESLLDNRILNNFKINMVRISSAENSEDRWHLYEVEATAQQLIELAKQLKPSGWYAHFWNGDDVMVIFPNKQFQIKYSERDTWKEAIKYGLSIGIPIEQLDFKID